MREYTQQELKRLQYTELDILKEIIRICKSNDIKYFTVGGTTLGAIRHDGFIPWDDDIDIGMLRSDYDKFLLIASEQLADDYFILNHQINKNFPSFFTKICKKGTIFLEKDTAKLKYNHGIFVDVFPFDNLPDNENKRKRAKRRIQFFDQLFKSKILWKISNVSTNKHKTIAKIIRVTLHIFLLPFSKKYLYNKLQKYLQKFNRFETDFVSACGRNALETKKSNLLPTIAHKFEDIFVEIPNNYEAVLTQQYGNYMALPPVEKRVSHCAEVLSFGDNNS